LANAFIVEIQGRTAGLIKGKAKAKYTGLMGWDGSAGPECQSELEATQVANGSKLGLIR